MVGKSLVDLWHGFGVALQPLNLIWSFVGVLLGNIIGVLPGMGPLPTIAILLPLTYALHPVPAILMLAGVFYGSIYGGAIGAILLNLPSHPAHAVTCLDGYPLTKQGKGGTALGIAMIASFFAACFGILVMIFSSPLLVKLAYTFGPTEIFSIMLLGLLAGATMAGRSPLKGIAVTLLGILCGTVGSDVNTGTMRFTLGLLPLENGIELVAIAMGVFAVGDFLFNVNRTPVVANRAAIRLRDMFPSKGELKQSFFAMVRGTLIGTAFGAMPGTGPTITSFLSYAFERRFSKTPERFGHGALEGVAGPEAAAHAKTQVDFIPTMTLGIPGDPVMALILGALIIQGINPGPQLITEHPDIFWGLIASFWIGNAILMILNVPLIGVWIKLLRVPYRYLFPSALFFVAIGVFSTNNDLFQVYEVLAFGITGAALMALDFPMAPILLGFVLGPRMETNFGRALLLSHGDMTVFVRHPISAGILSFCALLVAVQLRLYRAGGIVRQPAIR